MIDLIIRRNTVDTGFSVIANAGANVPMSTPVTIAIRIHDVKGIRRRLL
jgi:hypothetical protein